MNTIISGIESCRNSVVSLSVYCSERNESTRHALSSEIFDVPVYIHPQANPFSYNHELNRMAELAIEAQFADFLILANSDLVFHNSCIPRIVEIMQKCNLHSASPYDPWTHAFEYYNYPDGNLIPGYEIRKHITGWCVFISSFAYKGIHGLNEGVTFWYSDDIYADQLKRALIPHVLVTDAICEHLGSRTLSTVNPEEASNMTNGEFPKYLQAREKLNAKFYPYIQNENLSYECFNLDKLIMYLHFLKFDNLNPWEDELVIRFARQFVRGEYSIYYTIGLMHYSQKQLSLIKHNNLWNKVKVLLPEKKIWVARAIKWNLKIKHVLL